MENLLLDVTPRAAIHHGFTNIYGDSVDDLVRQGIHNIVKEGRKIKSRAGDAMQAYGVNYILKDPRSRVHSLRNGAKRYLCRELLAYFSGSLKAENGLANASKFWMTLTDKDGNVNSNYGYYVFYEPVEKYGNQYNWIVSMLKSNQDSRRAIININQNYHKSDTKDFPCTIGMQFFIRENHLFCETISRSTDVITGLPYDMGFFSFVHELVHSDLVSQGYDDLQLGSTIMKTTFTQIYDNAMEKAKDAMNGRGDTEMMPEISSAKDTLGDIYAGSAKTDVIKWIYENAE
ncbi:thymidylate synthase family protein [Burkholderia thailandensis MSMB121]|uniref:Thymidylate synthase n=2 Tax=Burkholderia humptydooensis TaxID=430531 RepID=A0A7U4SS13_9BURK|nr:MULTISPECIES: thymidylate synthase [Burkholderia]AGK47630.1 thymidylate synthase family protein [Burkholderia thailandensis MSMB121]ATF36865.1 thymidylate synthase [Burkholderia thailandensis]AJY42405.1 thymidylate synthase family protein [Burkholderia sp. 2002721687]ALX42535.1 thymidylate synthase [Burkholderia humptydooensis]EIP87919.1 thymidylate synthase [Burkholderia humptydooensis MSMB43]